MFFDNLASALSQIKGGNVRAIAVTGTQRSPLLPDVPTVAESGVPDYQYYVWFGFWAPKKTPQPRNCTARSKKRSPSPSCSSASRPPPESRLICRLPRSRRSSKPRSRNGPTSSNAALSYGKRRQHRFSPREGLQRERAHPCPVPTVTCRFFMVSLYRAAARRLN